MKVRDGVRPPAVPASLFEFLQKQEAEKIVVKGFEARRIPHLQGPTFVAEDGRLCCRHGASRSTLKRKRKAQATDDYCGCELGLFPKRKTSLKGMRLGRCEARSEDVGAAGSPDDADAA